MAHQVNTWSRTQPVGGRRQRRSRLAAAGFVCAAFLAMASLTASAQAASVALGSAAGFAVLGGSTVTNTGSSVISGDLGVSPGTAVTGFPPGKLTGGTMHVNDGVAAQAQRDLTTAYNDARGRSSTSTISADLAGSTLTPGVYTSATPLGLNGDLTLDGQGDPNAVFVFQAGSTLTVSSASRVLLIGRAQACNVFWQIGSSATIGSTSPFAGNILALTDITLTTGATLSGRALARNGAVTLDTNTITRPACSPPPSVTDTSTTTGAGQPVSVVLHGTDSTGAQLTYAIIGGPSHGTLGPINQSSGTVTYTPGPGYSGPDSFTYQATSNNGTSNTATATVTVTPAASAAATGTAPPPASAAATGTVTPAAGGNPTRGPGAARPSTHHHARHTKARPRVRHHKRHRRTAPRHPAQREHKRGAFTG